MSLGTKRKLKDKYKTFKMILLSVIRPRAFFIVNKNRFMILLKKNFMEEHQEKENASAEREPTMRINEKGIKNSYIEAHLFNKGIKRELIEKCLKDGREVTAELKSPKKGSRYFRLEVPDGANVPGRFVLPDFDGVHGGNVASWNELDVKPTFRHGRMVPTIPFSKIPGWLMKYTGSFYVILEKNQLSNGLLQIQDGPTENDPEKSWFVATAHFGPPSEPKPRVPRRPKTKKLPDLGKIAAQKNTEEVIPSLIDCLSVLFSVIEEEREYSGKVRDYQEELAKWYGQESRMVYVDFEERGQAGFSQDEIQDKEIADISKEMTVMQNVIETQKQTIEELNDKIQNAYKLIERMRRKNDDNVTKQNDRQ